MEDVKFLKTLPLFEDLTQFEVIRVAKETRNREAKAGETIIEEGSNGDALFILKEGAATAYRGDGAQRQRLNSFAPGDNFGEISLIDRQPRSASVIADSDCVLIEIGGKAFDSLLNQEPQLEKKLLRALLQDLCRKIRKGNEQTVLI
jgi:CRP-like cAMP-binding protein